MKKIALSLLLAGALFAGAKQETIRTQVRVRTGDTGGSGTVIGCEKQSEFQSCYILTCWHVVEKAIEIKNKWNPTLGADKKVEVHKRIWVELFGWDRVPHGRAPMTQGVDVELLTYDVEHDMALLRVVVDKKLPVANLPVLVQDAKGDWLTPKSIQVGDTTVAVGCALGHSPVLTEGTISSLGDDIEGKVYWMSTAQIIFGNSGGALFHETGTSYEFIGVPSRIAVTWNTPVTHIGYSSPVTRVYEFLDDREFDFLIPGSELTSEDCRKLRDEARSVEERRRILP